MLLIITGPTASGKTLLAESVSRELDGEIISADSRTRYRSLRIGTGRDGLCDDVVYHIIDDLEPDEFSSSFEWTKKAREKVARILEKRKLPVICGGSMHFIQTFIGGMDPAPPPDPELRSVLRVAAERNGQKYLYDILDRLDHQAACGVHPNNTNRIIRYIEKAVGEEMVGGIPAYEGEYILISTFRDRGELNRMISTRTRKMIDNGWVDEVRTLLEDGHSPRSPCFTSTGYPHIIDHVMGSMDIDEAERAVNRDTIELSRKQIRWCRAHNTKPLDLSGVTDIGPIVTELSSQLQQVE